MPWQLKYLVIQIVGCLRRPRRRVEVVWNNMSHEVIWNTWKGSKELSSCLISFFKQQGQQWWQMTATRVAYDRLNMDRVFSGFHILICHMDHTKRVLSNLLKCRSRLDSTKRKKADLLKRQDDISHISVTLVQAWCNLSSYSRPSLCIIGIRDLSNNRNRCLAIFNAAYEGWVSSRSIERQTLSPDGLFFS